MFRRLLPLAALVAAVLGCSRKDDAPATGPGNPNAPVAATDPNATYTITFRGPAKGDKVQVVKTRTGSMTTGTPNSSQTQHEKLRDEYTETVLDTAPDEPRPTKVSRVYKAAERSDPDGKTKSLALVGKTVTIEKFRESYKYAADGKVMVPAEQQELHKDFTGSRWSFDGMLPKGPVKVGEEWAGDLSRIKALTGNLPFPYQKDKSTITGKLTRAYKRGGQQWGVIEWNIDIVFDTHATNGSPIKGSLPSNVTMDAVIDGSARAGTMKISTKGTIDHRDMIGHEVKTTIEGVQEQSITPVP